jgi:hypothetical protein
VAREPVEPSTVSTSDPGNPQIGPNPPPPLIPFWEGGPPPVDPAQVTPSVADVAALEATRRVQSDGDEADTFTSDTRPTDVQCQDLIVQATQEVTGMLPACCDPIWYAAIRRVIALRVASLIEVSYYREQAQAGPAAAHATQFVAELQTLQKVIPCLVVPLVA